MGLVLAPIEAGKEEAWKAWAEELNGPRKDELANFNERYGLTRHACWFAEMPQGAVIAALHEGPGAEELMPKLAQSDVEFDVWFRGKLEEIHGMRLDQPPPGPMPVLKLDARA
jgi:hypothetical protein